MAYSGVGSPRFGLHYGGPAGLPAIFAVAGGGVARLDASYDGGLTWVTRDTSFSHGGVAVSPEMGRVIAPGPAAGALLRYSDNGVTFQNGTKLAPGGSTMRNVSWGGQPGARHFVIAYNLGAGTVRVTRSPTGIGGWTSVDVTVVNSSSPTIFWDESRLLWVLLLDVTPPAQLQCFTSPDAAVWSLAFTGPAGVVFDPRYISSGPNNRLLCVQNSPGLTFWGSDSPTLSVWDQIDVGPWSEQRVIAGSNTLFFAAGISPTGGGVSATGGVGSWVDVTVPGGGWDARYGVYVPIWDRFIALSLAGGAAGGIFTSSAPNLGAASWTRRETTGAIWQGQIAYGRVG